MTGASVGTLLAPSDADAIRSRLLHKLGIYDPDFTNASMYHKSRTIKYEGRKRSSARRTDQLANQGQGHGREGETRSKNVRLPAACLVPIKFGDDPQSRDGTIDDPHPISGDASSGGSLSETLPSPNTKRPALVVTFHPRVRVTPVLTHRSLSSRANARLYVPQHELAVAIARNTREFAYEGWDWRNVVEEEGMYVCPANGEYVHPAHVVRRVADPYH